MGPSQGCFGWCAAALVLGCLAGICPAVSIDRAVVGDARNVHGDGVGQVDYVYRISKYEVTNAQYREFLGAKAALGDPYALYNPGELPGPPGDRRYSGISRSGSGTPEDPFVYLPKNEDAEWDKRPVNYVCWFDAIRFANWLQNGQGDGETEWGIYTILDGGANSGEVIVPTTAERAAWSTPHFVLPSEDEWYKAAFYKGGGTNAGYWDYATRSDTVPNNNPPWEDTGNSANHHDLDGGAVGPPYYVTEVGAYGLSGSAYGTFDQNGNTSDWNDHMIDDVLFQRIWHKSRVWLSNSLLTGKSQRGLPKL